MPNFERTEFCLSFDTCLTSQTALDDEIWRFKVEQRLRRKSDVLKLASGNVGHFSINFVQILTFMQLHGYFCQLG